MKQEVGIIFDSSVLAIIAEMQQTLENLIVRIESGILEESSMQQRTRVKIGTHDNGKPIYKQIKARDVDSLNDRIVQTYIEHGRISEFLSRDGQQKLQTKTLFQPFVESFMMRFKKGKLKPRSFDEYRKVLLGKLIPEFGNTPIEEITTASIQDFLNRNSAFAESSLKSWMNILRPILKYAVEHIIQKNPATSMTITIPSRKRSERISLTEKQFADVLAQIKRMKNSQEKLGVAVIAYTGMRRGEMLGLRWEDVDFEKGIIRIKRSIKHIHNQPLLEDMTTKTESGVREVSLLKDLAEILRPMRGNGYLLGGTKPLTAGQYLTTRNHVKKTINLYGATEHVLRHTFLTFMEASGVDLKTLQTYAGHSNISTTMQVYVHPQEGQIKKAGQTMETLLHNLSVKGANMQDGAA